MESSILAPRAVDFTVELIQNTLHDLAERSPYNLEDSIHAPADVRRHRQHLHAANFNRSNSIDSVNVNNKSLKQQSSLAYHNTFSPSTPMSSKAWSEYSNLDDTTAFMDAVRRRRPETALTSTSVSPGLGIRKPMKNENPMTVPLGLKSELAGPGINQPGHNYDSRPCLLASKWAGEPAAAPDAPFALGNPATPSAAPIASGFDVVERKGSTDSNIFQGGTSCPTNKSLLSTNRETSRPFDAAEGENRTNLTTFKTWGTPITRGKPAAQVRRIILRALRPSNHNTPAKVLSLIHGGMIESVSISPSGDAHVLFCDAAACKAYYDKYPNGIALSKDGHNAVFVDLGREVDVLSSQLSNYLAAGASRVVRVVGLEPNFSMEQLVGIASTSRRKVEKIIDTYIPQESRVVHFRFCSIEDAVRFKAAISRDEDWEHCNIQFAPDPCEKATGFHID